MLLRTPGSPYSNAESLLHYCGCCCCYCRRCCIDHVNYRSLEALPWQHTRPFRVDVNYQGSPLPVPIIGGWMLPLQLLLLLLLRCHYCHYGRCFT